MLALVQMKDLKTEFLFTCDKGMLLLKTSFSVTGKQEKSSWAWGNTASTLPFREEVGSAL